MNLIYEIGTEELPAGEVESARAALATLFVNGATAARLSFGAVRTYATPRRLALHVTDIAEVAETIEEVISGPASKVAFDANGTPTRAAEGFAKGLGVDPSTLIRVTTPKGEYVAARVVRQGRAARDVITEILRTAPGSIAWKRSMRWAWSEATFARPVHWIVALLGDDVLDVGFGDILAGRTSRGHRFLSPGPVAIENADTYLSALRQAHVIADVDERRDAIRRGVAELSVNAGLVPIADEGLIDEVVHLVELPVPLLGYFDENLLEVPREVLITTMRAHQRYFAAERADGNLANVFIFISNMVVDDPSVIIAGNLRVLRARLEDARFFYREDRKKPLSMRVDALGDVVYIDRLGSVLDRTRRIERLAEALAPMLYPGDDVAAADARRAAHLCKADLVTGMVYQFPELQGTMGRYYAVAAGERGAVATAIEEHYRPRGASDAPPTTGAGVIVSIAEKLDALVGCFALGLIPSGSADPYALRRSALGVVRTAIAHGLRFQMADALAIAFDGLPGGLRDRAQVLGETGEFVKSRLRALLAADAPTDVVDSVAEVVLDDLPTAPARVAALASLRGHTDFEPLAVAFKRVVNIVRKAADEDSELGTALLGGTAGVDATLLVEPAEQRLLEAVDSASARVAASIAAGEFAAVAATLVALKPAIDAFFDDVLVNATDPALRRARLALLARTRSLFVCFADISRIQVAG